jgi:hypothetical protein
MSEAPSPRSPVRRPRYLSVALAAALLIGLASWMDGCVRLAFYRGERDHGAMVNAAVKDEAARASLDSLWRHVEEVSDAARKRAVPLAAAGFVLGAALFALAARGLSGRSNARSALVQVVAAQAAVVVASYFLLRDVREAELDWHLEHSLAQQKAKVPPEQHGELVAARDTVRRIGPPAWLAVQTLASLLIVVALTRPRSRAFFEAAADTVSER